MTAAPFPHPTPAEWQALAIKALKDKPLEGLVHMDADHLTIKPLYAPQSGVTPLRAARSQDSEGRAWDLRTVVEGDDPKAVNEAILTDLMNGAASVLLKGGVLADADSLSQALDGVAVELAPVALDAGAHGVEAAEALSMVAKGAPRAKLAFHLDPISAFAETGAGDAEADLKRAAEAAARHARTYPEASLFMASGRVVHEAGGSAGQALGFAIASALSYVKAGVEAGLTLEQAVRGVVLGLSVDAEYFDALSAVRALRLMWGSLVAALGVEADAVIEARSSRRMLSARDPWPNLLRLTAAGFAGAVGGAEVVVLDGFTRAAGLPDAFARRQARNTQIVLMEEAHLGRVDDPAAGSWFLDARTHDLAEAGWAQFQRIEREGGVLAALGSGVIQAHAAEARRITESAYQKGANHMVGVTKFVDPDPRPALVEAEPKTDRPGRAAILTLTPIRFAEAFETAQQEAAR